MTTPTKPSKPSLLHAWICRVCMFFCLKSRPQIVLLTLFLLALSLVLWSRLDASHGWPLLYSCCADNNCPRDTHGWVDCADYVRDIHQIHRRVQIGLRQKLWHLVASSLIAGLNCPSYDRSVLYLSRLLCAFCACQMQSFQNSHKKLEADCRAQPTCVFDTADETRGLLQNRGFKSLT